jgi:photosystem II stability/assembly factor-like uncharacterized protein
MRARRSLLIVSIICFATLCRASEQPQTNPDLFKAMKWRLVGPFRGGRVLAVEGVRGKPSVFYFGAVAGGVWKTTDGGLNWSPLFDDQPVSSIGALAIAPSDPNIIYVGTGESCIRGDISFGDGVYKSVDGGKTWKNIGLPDTRHIAKILVSPRDPNTVFVAALGHAFGSNSERGVFRSTDGGLTWQKILFKDDHTGAIDLVFDADNSNILFAALWQADRSPWSLNSGGPGSGLYKSSDGGTTWKQLTGNGLPAGVWGRVGIAVPGANPDRVYAIIEAEAGGLYRSDDGGNHWKLVNPEHRLRQRPWYFDHVFADPKNSDIVYVLNVALYRSTDGGRSFTALHGQHGDHHALWIDPDDPTRMIDGNDGGANITTNGGATWTRPSNQPTAQFYHVSTDNRFEYYLYGAQQDSGTVAIASRTDTGTIGPSDVYGVGGGESGFVIPYLPNPDIVYADSYDGHITRFDKNSGQSQNITAWPDNPMGAGAAELKYRFQWTAPLAVSPFDPQVLYMGAQVLFRTTDGGHKWSTVSPDLTRNDKSKQAGTGGPITQDNTSVEYYDTIFAIAESPRQAGLIWVGADDGLVHVSRDNGKSWIDVTPRQQPEWGTVNLIEPSPHDAATAYLAVDRHKMDDFQPYIYKTSDYGKSWSLITAGLPGLAYVHAVRQDPANAKLLYAGTETGIFVSFDDGVHWQSLQLNLPRTPVYDLVIKNNDLVVATHGRSFWILDDITPLRELSKIGNAEAYFYTPQPAYRPVHGGETLNPSVGNNPPGGAILDYYLSADVKDPVSLEIFDQSGKLVRQFSSTLTPDQKRFDEQEKKLREGFEEHEPKLLPGKKGMNRWIWNLKYNSPSPVPGLAFWGDEPEAPVALPGTYQATLAVNQHKYSVPVEIKMDPRVASSEIDLKNQFDLASKISRLVEQATEAENQIMDLRLQLAELREHLAAEGRSTTLSSSISELEHKMTGVEQRLVETRSKAGEDPLQYPLPILDKMMLLQATVESADTAPTQQSYDVYDLLSPQCIAALKEWNDIVNNDLKKVNDALRMEAVPLLWLSPATASPN